jgi:hypothetical protein
VPRSFLTTAELFPVLLDFGTRALIAIALGSTQQHQPSVPRHDVAVASEKE